MKDFEGERLMSRKIGCLYFILMTSLFFSSVAHAANITSSETTEVKDWAIVLREATLYATGGEKTPGLTQGYLSLVRQIRTRADNAKTKFQNDLRLSEKLLKAIGPLPIKGSPPEAKEIADKRERYNRQITTTRARIAEADSTIVHATELEEILSRQRFERLLGEVYRRTPIPISPGVFIKGVSEIAAEVRRILLSPFDWLAKLPPAVGGSAALLPGIVVLILGAVFGWGIRRSALDMFGRDPSILEPSYARRFGAAIAEGFGNGILPGTVLIALYLWVTRPGALVSGLFVEVLTSLLFSMLFFFLVVVFARSFLSPDQPTWRFTGQSSKNAQSAYRLIFFLVAVFSIDMFFSKTQRRGEWLHGSNVYLFSGVWHPGGLVFCEAGAGRTLAN